MLIKQGIPVSPGVAIATAVVIDAEDAPIPRRQVAKAKLAQEHRRLERAIHESANDIGRLREQAAAKVGPELAKIFDFHLGMLKDKQLVEQFTRTIDEQRVTAEFAVYSVMRDTARNWKQIGDRYIRERVTDIFDLERRLLSHLIGNARAELAQLKNEAIVIAHELTPSQTAGLDRTRIKGIATDAGGRTSHTAILAHALGIPAIVGLEDITQSISSGDTVIIDGDRGTVIIDPDASQLMEYRQHVRRMEAFEHSLGEEARLPAVTKDGTKITLWANIEFPKEIEAALQKGATGIGLYRTEFLFLASDRQPTEDEQYEAYRQALHALAGKPLTIRTLDLGADKLATTTGQPSHPEPNPFLGVRSIRLCLQNLPLFKTQLRAILRASVDGPIRVMFPLISNVMELRQAKMILTDVMEDLDDQGIAYRENIPVGVMIEVPSAALQAKVLAREVNFFSIGTNDLIQYTVAVDRSNERIASLYSGAHPSVILLVKEVVRSANRAKVDVSLCGEMAGEPEFVMLLLGLGLRNFSITPPAIPEVKRIIRSVTMDHCQKVARKASGFDTDREVLNYLRDEVRRVLPEVFHSPLES